MRKPVNNNDILVFLNKMKQLVSEGKYTLVQRKKNIQSLIEFGLTVSDIKDILLSLELSNYYAGPKSDYDFSEGDIWEFIKRIENVLFYIKLKIIKTDEEYVVCISFHKSNNGGRS